MSRPGDDAEHDRWPDPGHHPPPDDQAEEDPEETKEWEDQKNDKS
jgi:hypothetical protein